MEKTVNTIKEERKELQDLLQREYNNCKTYQEKLINIYKTLLKSQYYYLQYKNNNTFNKDYLPFLIQKLDQIENLDDKKFLSFIFENIVSPLNSGHVYIKFDSSYAEELFRIYENLKKENNVETTKFLNENNIEDLILEVNNIENLDDVKFLEFIKKRILDKIPEDNVIVKRAKEKVENENVTITALDNTIIIKIESFSSGYLEKDKIKFEELSNMLQNGSFENIIIDIRNNSGGTDQYFQYFSSFTNENIICKDIWANLFTNEVENCNWLAIPSNPNAKNYKKYLLINDKVFSSADCLARICKETGYATVIGEPTMGEGCGVTPLRIKISDNASINLPVEAPVNNKGNIDYQNFYNTVPNIICSSEQALTIALSIINSNKVLEEVENQGLNL